MTDIKQRSHEDQLIRLFGGYRAEWLKGREIFDLFEEPSYFPELKSARPCILEGGRGTGKTTVLKGLSYEGQYFLSGSKSQEIGNCGFFGLYYRVNTNRVTAFKGPEVHEATWIKLFSHYFNLVLCGLISKLIDWLNARVPGSADLDLRSLEKIALSLNITPISSGSELSGVLDSQRIGFEAHLNNIADEREYALTMLGSPIDVLVEEMQKLEICAGKNFFFLLDEYENFEPYQQRIVNTLIKHSERYTFKVGLKELGLRTKSTLNLDEQLMSPSDYVRIEISEKLKDEQFRDFALKVCNGRISRLEPAPQVRDVREVLQNLSEDEEAELLGVNDYLEDIRAELAGQTDPLGLERLDSMSPLEQYFIAFWARTQGIPISESLRLAYEQPKKWKERFGNYKHSLLYTIRHGKVGFTLNKYYCGWDTYTLLAASNIRYLLELVDQSLLLHLKREHGSLLEPMEPKTQTLAARSVARKNLLELEGLSIFGAQITKLVLGLGRIFQVMAFDAAGHAPEVNQFHIQDGPGNGSLRSSVQSEAKEILTHAVMHLALIRFPGNKAGAEAETQEFDYMIHPILAPFFEFSYRRKRRLTLSTKDFLGLIHSPRTTIPEILKRSKRSSEQPLPDQMRIFEGYFSGGA